MSSKGAFSRFLEKLEVPHEPGLTQTQLFLRNEDLLPVEPDRRKWRGRNFIAFWIADSFNINTWMIVSSMITNGLSWYEAWICVWLGYACVAPFLVLNARPGAVHHITFPVVARSSFGLWGALWTTLNRGIMACIWYGVQASIGGTCMIVMLRAIWPSVENIPNGLPDSAGITTRDMLGFFLFWFISLPAIWFPIHKIRHLFTAKAIVVPIAGITFFVWAIVKAHGVGPIIHQPSKLHGSAKGWAMVSAFGSCMSNMATLIVNAPDFASRADRPSSAVWPQLIGIPLGFSIVSFLGIIVSSSSEVIYGTPVWSPIDLLNKFLDGNPSHATRFGVWFISASFILAQLGTNISANSVSAGCDLTSLFPRFINIRRGGYIAAIVGFAICPWNLLKSSNSFTSYLSAYSVFLSSIAGVMVSDYWVVRRGHVRVTDLYTTRRDGWYWYNFGINWRAYAAYVAGIMINVVGFASVARPDIPIAAIRIYELAFLTGFGTSMLFYVSLNYFFPPRGVDLRKSFEEIDETNWEEGMRPEDSPAPVTMMGDSDSAIRVRHGAHKTSLSEDEEDQKVI
ncbi:NCS1 nucleoside transporter family [Clavulina sp. PMI_390]|nr:NCS1 nucleoside transporter family [Clavulina sp. PMI_390]